jgi:hypothetical protein
MNREQLKKLIRESVDEVINEIGAVDYNDYEPMDSAENHVGEWLNDLKDSLKTHLEMVDKDQDPNGDHYEGMFADAEKVYDFIENRNISQEEKDIVNNDGELESLLGRVHRYRGNSSGEKMYMRETWEEAISSGQLEEDILTEKAPPGMEPWVKANKERFVKQYGKKKGIGVLYATAWKMFYKSKKRDRSSARRSGE